MRRATRRSVRVVLDPNVLVAAVVAPGGVCAELLERLARSAVGIVLSRLVLAEVESVLVRPKFSRIDTTQRAAYLAFLERISTVVEDPPDPSTTLVERDPGDDYLVRLVIAEPGRLLVTGDPHLLELSHRHPIVSPRTFLDQLTAGERL